MMEELEREKFLAEIKEGLFFKQLSEPNKDKFVKFYNFIVNHADPQPEKINKVYFTPHDLYHCKDVFNILQKFDVKLNEYEIYLLMLSAFMHDIGMQGFYIDLETRKKHMDDARKKIIGFREDKNFAPCVPANYDNNLCCICVSHSDSKIEKHLIKNISDSENARTKLLAALLRFADELDICAKRMGTNTVNYNNIEGVPENEKEGVAESYRRWRQLQLFSFPSLDVGRVVLNVNNILIEEDNTIFNKYKIDDLDLIRKAKIKVCESYEELKPIFKEYNIKSLSELKIELNMPDLDDVANDDILTLRKDNESRKEPYKERRIDIGLIRLINSDNKQKFSEILIKHDLMQYGHYWFNKTIPFCSRRYINTARLIQEINDENKYEKNIARYLAKTNLIKEDTLILGVNELGFILAAGIGFLLRVPFARVTSSPNNKNDSDSNDTFVKELIRKTNNVILIFDVVSTCHTADEVIGKYSLLKKTSHICSAFYKKCTICAEDEQKKNEVKSFTENFLKKYTVATLYDDFYDELIENSKCPMKLSDSCINSWGKE